MAVALVMLAHAGVPYPKSGGAGVDIFFVLSGFLITGILARESQQTGRISIVRFYTHRCLRLVPALALAIALFSLRYIVNGQEYPTTTVLFCASYTANWARALFGYDLGSMGHCWSLAIEEQYYLVWPFAIFALERMVSTKRARFSLLVALAIAIAIRRAVLAGHVPAGRIYFGIDTHCDGLVWGSALSYLCAGIQNLHGAANRRLAVVARIAAPAALLFLALVMWRWTWSDVWMSRFGLALLPIAAAVVILRVSIWEDSMLGAFLRMPPMRYLGRISYGLYLYHPIIYVFVDRTLPGSGAGTIPLKIALTVVFAGLSYRFVERPFLDLKARVGRRAAPAPGASLVPTVTLAN